ncbi:MAG: hypothetical protein ACLVIQ_11910 [Parabacteroides distasonis]
MEQIMRIFDDTRRNLPVVDEEGRYIGTCPNRRYLIHTASAG